MKFFALSSCILAGTLLLGGTLFPAQAEISSRELKPALEQLLREHPEIVLDFLRQHSEAVLDIAQKGSNQRRVAAMERQWKADAKVPKHIALENRPQAGNPYAKVRIVAFSDFTCQYCQRAEKVVAELLKEYEGKVSFVFKNMPLEKKGISGLASQYFVAIAMQNEKLAWTFYRTLFENRDRLTVEGEAFLRQTAVEIGVDMRQLDTKRRQKSVANIIDEDLKDAEKLHVEGTPYFLVNNLVIRGAIPKDLFRRAIEIELIGH